MSNIGYNIKKYRLAKNITQDQLGQMIGVTTQAISKWERGGTPDAEILPSISKELGVSIDALFGHEEESLTITLARKLSQMEQDEAVAYAFEICWAIENGLVGDVSAIDDFMKKMINSSVTENDKKKDYFAKIITDSGISLIRMSPDFRHYFLLTEPNSTIKEQISEPEKIRRVFEILADKTLLRIIFYLHSISHMPIAASLISKNVGIDAAETDRCMKILCDNNIAEELTVATIDGNINAYQYRRECSVIPLICLADELTKTDIRPFFGCFNRKKPLL